MKPLEERLPLFVRRLIGPIALFGVVFGAVWLLARLGVPLTDVRLGKNYGALAIGIAAALVATRLLDYLFFDIAFRVRRKAVAPALLRQLVSLAVFGACVAILFKLILPDVSLGAVFTTSAIITAVIGLALQETLGNLFAGLSLHLQKTVQVGDMVRTGETYGTVEELSWRAIKLRTMEGNLLLVPNSMAGRQNLEVYPRPGRPIARLLHVGLEYETSPERAKETLKDALRGLPGLAASAEPVVYLKTFDAYAITYEVRYWLEDYARYLEIDSQARERVWYALERAGIKIAFPVIRQWQYAAGHLEHPSRHEIIASAIGRAELVAPLSAEEKERLVAGARELRYGPGETIVREGDTSSAMFLIESGRVGISIHGAAGDTRALGVLEAGSAFGEISLLTGEPRTATVRALLETQLVEIDKETLAGVLRGHPGLAESLGAIMRERQKVRTDLFDASREEMARMQERVALGERIARFFGLR